MCFCYQFSDERDSRAHPGAGLGRGGDSLLSQSAAVRLLFLDHHPFSGCASHLHTFVSSQGGLQLIKAFSYNLPESCCFQPLPAAEREHCLAQGGKKKEKKRKRRGEESRREGVERQHVLQSKTKEEGWYKGIHCLCLCLVFSSPLEAGSVLC